MEFTITKHTDHIVQTAITLFRNNGYEQVSISEICKVAGISRSVFYAAFSDKAQIIEYMYDQVLRDQTASFGDFIDAENDFERMWILCDRYLAVSLAFGPRMRQALFQLDVVGAVNILDKVREVEDWMIRLCRNCQKTGIILSPEPAEIIAPLSVSAVWQVNYDWARSLGSFDLRARARRTSEAVLNVAPEYRWPQEQ